MNDLIEVQYELARCAEALQLVDEQLAPFTKRRQQLLDELTSVNDTISKIEGLRDKLIDAQKQLNRVKPLVLSEPDAVATIKAAAKMGQFTYVKATGTLMYRVDAKTAAERMVKAITTINADQYAMERDGDDYLIEIENIPQSYLEFFGQAAAFLLQITQS